jgi:3'-phosphoadenosine 5'-phosphosulfate sulfotransferase
LYGLDGQRLPSFDEIERSMAAARQLRSEALYEYIARAAASIRAWLLPAPKGPVAQSC